MKLMPCKPLLVENEALHFEPSLISADTADGVVHEIAFRHNQVSRSIRCIFSTIEVCSTVAPLIPPVVWRASPGLKKRKLRWCSLTVYFISECTWILIQLFSLPVFCCWQKVQSQIGKRYLMLFSFSWLSILVGPGWLQLHKTVFLWVSGSGLVRRKRSLA